MILGKTALVLAGGGGKGAYQIGVWKALKELGYENEIGAVAGTSVGGLNAALFAQGDYETAEGVWLNISREKIHTPNLCNLVRSAVHLYKYVSVLNMLALLRTGAFSRTGLLEIIQENLEAEKIAARQMPCYVTCYNMENDEADYIDITGMEMRKIEKALLATSAIPGIFQPVRFGNYTYLDGGMKDNVPVKPLYDLGYRKFLVIHLGREGHVEEDEFPGSAFLQIVPSEDQGDFMTGTLDFSEEGSRRRIQQGYEDGMALKNPLLAMKD